MHKSKERVLDLRDNWYGSWNQTQILGQSSNQLLSLFKNILRAFCLHVCLSAEEPEEGIRSPRTEGKDVCKYILENWAQVLYQSRGCS